MRFVGILLISILVLGAVFVYPGDVRAALTFTRDLSRGLSGDSDVASLQQFLVTNGYYTGPVSGNFGSLTEEAVRKFQQMNNLVVSGIFDTASRLKANSIVANPTQQPAGNGSSVQSPTSQTPSASTPPASGSSSSGTATQGNPGNTSSTPLKSSENHVYKPSPTEDQGIFGVAQPPIFCTCSGNFLVKVEGPYGGMFIAKKLSKIPVGLAIGTARGAPEKCKMFVGFGCITIAKGKVIKELFGGLGK